MRNKIDGDTVLMKAAGRGHTDIVKLLLEAGAEVNAKTAQLEKNRKK
jgi:ankyrin repeat protein